MRDIVFHVGIHRTGTTFLQTRCYPFLTDVHLVCRENYSASDTGSFTDRLARLAGANPLFLDLDAEQAVLERCLARVDQRTVLISMERWFGSMWHGFSNNQINSQTLRHLFPAARIILTIRRQDTLLESLYRQILRGYGYPTVDCFLNLVDGRFLELGQNHTYFPSINPRTLDFHGYVRNYAALFGDENVLVLPLERMVQDPRGYFETLCGFIGTEPYYPDTAQPVHEGYSLLSSRIALVLNRFVRVNRRGAGSLPRFLPPRPLRHVLTNVVDRHAHTKGQLIDDRTRRLVMDLLGDSNRALDEDLGLGLRPYGYY